MGARILATGVSLDRAVKSSIAHAAIAARACLEAAGASPDDVDVLIDVGIYRDANMVEPSMAALVQRELGMHLDYVKYPTGRSGLSFDLMNGASGIPNALGVARACLATGSERVLIVSSDAHPSGERVPGFPYASVGAAILLGREDDPARGLGRLAVRDDHAGGDSLAGYSVIDDHRGRSRIEVERAPDHEARILALAASLAREHLARERLERTDDVVLVSSQPSPEFSHALAERLELPAGSAVRIEGVDGDPHTSALALGYHQARAAGRLGARAVVLFVAAGAGPTAACIVHRA